MYLVIPHSSELPPTLLATAFRAKRLSCQIPDAAGDKYAADLACETGIRYSALPAMLNRNALLIRISVRSIPCYPGLSNFTNGIS